MKKKLNPIYYVLIVSVITLLYFHLSSKSEKDSYEIIFYSDCEDEEIAHDMVYYSESILEIETPFNINVAIREQPDRCGVEIWGDTLIRAVDGVMTDVDMIDILNEYAESNN